MTKITALVHTYNAELYLEECLAALTSFDEIIVCDMYSDDRTLEIAAQYGARVIFHDKMGFVEPARNFGIQSSRNEWVLIVDSDEIVTPELRDYINNFLDGNTQYAALRIPRIEYFMGRSLRSTYPDYITRLVHRDKTNWPATIHAQPEIAGELFKIPSSRRELAMIHYANPSIGYRMTKLNNYSDREVDRKLHRPKYASFWLTYLSASVKFFKGYIIKGGFLNGKAGLSYCTIEFFYKFVVLFKIWEVKRASKLQK